MDTLKAMRANIAEMKQQMAKEAKEGLSKEFKKFFAEWPSAEAIRWTQYTPFFNDGDPCVFRVNEPTVQIGDEGGDYDDGFTYGYEFERDGPERQSIRAINDALNSCEDVLQLVFGDHCQVTVWRDKPEIEVEEYSHD